MGVGKTTVGELIAARLGVVCRDTDADIVAAQGRPVSAVFAEDGEGYFRGLESAAVRTALAEHTGVLALGGGAVLDPGVRGLLAGRPVAFLDLDPDEAVARLGTDTTRPLLAVDPARRWRELADARRPLYAEVARVVVHTGGRTPEQVADAVLTALAAEPAWVPYARSE
ncbi:shikimate kinase [Streptomyces sp. NPDC059096]|uniref:shikimate kinase n=1 Tax=Streptomyces sp. NPDC059096 TaxID=3346727 RepID=UPI0036A30D94